MTRENSAEPDFESQAEAAWDELEAALAERLAGMGPDDLAIIESLEAVELHGATPYVQFCAWETERGLMLRAEAVSNHYLDATRQLSPSGERELESLGFGAPTYGVGDEPDSGSANWYVDLLAEDAELLADMTVRAFRRAYGITHPAFLTADGLLPDAPARARGSGAAATDEPPVLAVVDSPDALREVTAPVLEELLGQPPHRDDDGDFLVPSEHGAFWVLPAPRRARPRPDRHRRRERQRPLARPARGQPAQPARRARAAHAHRRHGAGAPADRLRPLQRRPRPQPGGALPHARSTRRSAP